ncbi:Hypothetical protein FKW44_017528 [Caligus rogercresseyi]|uniref:Uncharacterized protein n=1 Tax=Caligus rogercresseyi TaxID=217165 RepID=A0A7T8GT25_CALRO|nr:Hypothetical protein FKW44_017528 [Caligus rogercresseyi]
MYLGPPVKENGRITDYPISDALVWSLPLSVGQQHPSGEHTAPLLVHAGGGE